MDKESLIYKSLELFKIVDIAGMVVGLGMMVFGMIEAGVLVTVTSAGTYVLARKIQNRSK